MAAQLALYDPQPAPAGAARPHPAPPASEAPLCAACRAREARYGFQSDRDDPQAGRPQTLCFECFRLEIGRRQEAARLVQTRLPLTPRRAGPGGGVRGGYPALEQTLDALNRRRRRAQIAARKALGL
jgi:hypothetical protein